MVFVTVLAPHVLFVQQARAVDELSEEVCSNVCFPRNKDGLFSCQQECSSEDDVELPTGIDFLIKRVRDRLKPPILDKMEILPSSPRAGESMDIYMTPKDTDVEYMIGLKAKFAYSTNGTENWVGVIPDLEPVEKRWKAEIKLPRDADSLYYLARLGDEDRNTYIELPCETTEPHPGSKDCFFPMSEDSTYEKTKNFAIDPALDLTKSWIAIDDRRFYFRIQAVGDIAEGELFPANYYFYLLALYDPGRPTDVDPYHKTTFVLFSPLYFLSSTCSSYRTGFGETEFNNEPNAPCTRAPCPPFTDEEDKNVIMQREHNEREGRCITQSCAAIIRRGRHWINDTGIVNCEKRGNEIFISLQRETIEPPVEGVYVAFTATGVHLDMETAIITDYSPTTAFRIAPGQVMNLK